MTCLGFEPMAQDGRQTKNHGAMVAVQNYKAFLIVSSL